MANTGTAAPVQDSFQATFDALKLQVVRPAFEKAGAELTARGHEVSIADEPGGQISIHIVPAGAKKSIHPPDWFPTFSVFGAPFTKTIGLHARNARPSSEGAPRGTYRTTEINAALVEKELMRFVGEISNW